MNRNILLTVLLTLTACERMDSSAPIVQPATSPADEVATAEVISEEVMGADIRPEVGGLHGAVVSGHPLASQIGYEVLRQGGNATDAVVTMAAVLAVVRPHMNSVGGDAFGLFYNASSNEIVALNGSGRAGALATPDFFFNNGLDRVPFSGAKSITVPGAVSAWSQALDRFGSISWEQALQPAIEIAEDGFMVTQTLAEDLFEASSRLNSAGQAIYRPDNIPLTSGDRLRSPSLARSLHLLQEQGPDALYGGNLGEVISAFILENGGHLTLDDFRQHTAEWQPALTMEFKDYHVHTVAPNSQGMVMLQMLGMAENIDFSIHTPNGAALLHQLIEITKVAFADRDRWIYDPAFQQIPIEQLLDKNYLRDRYENLTDTASRSSLPGFGEEIFSTSYAHLPATGDTVYLMAVDADGNAVSWIQSLFGTFGSNLVEPTTGIVLQNRGAGFSLEEGNPNQIAPGKRPFHTLMATLVTDADGALAMTVGTPGGGGQPQFITQALIQTLVFDMSPQRAVEEPRYRTGSGSSVELERRLPPSTIRRLESLGHDVSVATDWTANFGSVKMIQRLPNGVLRTGADMRREGTAMAY